jgi:proline racemase
MTMRRIHAIDVLYTHTEGEPTCIIQAGVQYPPGSDILAKRRHLEQNYDWLRCALMREPRGHADMFGVFLTPPSSADADAGMIWIDGTQWSHMCGHGTIALSMAMVATGLVPQTGDLTRIRFETTAGPVVSEVGATGDEVEWCRFRNVPAYLAERDIPLELPGIGEVKADIAFGGNYFGIIDWRGRQPRIAPENGAFFSEMGVLLREQLRAKCPLRHPTQGHITNLNFMTFWHEPSQPGSFYRCVHVFSEGQLDRSPGGTGTSAMMAMFEGRGMMRVGETIRSEGLLGSGTFEGGLVEETRLGSQRALVPTVKGTASILGSARWLIDRDDPVQAGFIVR